MSSKPESPDAIGVQVDDPVRELVMDCWRFSIANRAFRQKRSHHYGRICLLDSDDGQTQWNASFDAGYISIRGAEANQYQIGLTGKRSTNALPADLEAIASDQGRLLPQPETVTAVDVTYRARYTLSCFETLGWSLVQMYDVHHHDDNPLFTDDPCKRGQQLAVTTTLAEREAPRFVERPAQLMQKGDYVHAMSLELYASQAADVFYMISQEDTDRFDPLYIFPHELVAES